MKAREIVGKRIVKVDQVRVQPRPGDRPVMAWERIWLEDGTFIYPITRETEIGEYLTTLHVGGEKRRVGL